MSKLIEGKAAAPWGDAVPASATGAKSSTPAASTSSASTRTKWIALFAAPLAIAAASGSVAGALAAMKLTRPAAEATQAAPVATLYETRALQGAITQLRTDLAALKTNADAATKSATGQFAKIGERFDRIERIQPAPARLTTGSAREITASVSPQSAQQAIAATSAQHPRSRAIAGWSIRDVYLGMALIEDRRGGTIEVMPGDVIRGIGRVEEIRKQDGRWVVVTSRGLITAAR